MNGFQALFDFVDTKLLKRYVSITQFLGTKLLLWF